MSSSKSKKMELSTSAQVGLTLLKAANYAYDLVTLPVYTVVQSPWNKWSEMRKVFGQPTVPEDPRSPWVRSSSNQDCLFEGIETIDQLTRNAIRDFGDHEVFGTRKVLGEEEEKQPDGKIFKKLVLGDYEWMSYNEMDRKLDLIGRGLMSLGVRPRQNVVILAETRVEWMLTAQACLRINIPVVTLYATLGEDGIIHGINETEATHLITSQDLLPKVVKNLPQMTSLTHIIYMESPIAKNKPMNVPGINLKPFSQLEVLGETADPELKGEKPGPHDTAIIMYTSGSTGVPKGVIITQKNIVTTAKGFSTICPDLCPKDTYIAYLPLAHVLELACESLSLSMGAKIGYSSPLTLTDKSTGVKMGQQGDATLLRPTIMVSVPLILDRVRKNISEVAESKGAFAKKFLEHAVSYKIMWQSFGFGTPILDKLVFSKMKALLGGKVRVIASGSAPLSTDTHEFIKACLGCHVVQGYGLTETAACAAIMQTSDHSFGRVGGPLAGVYIKLVDWDEAGYHATDKPNPRGEIVIGGDAITKGYYKNEALTAESFREEGGIRWFYTGDIGEMYPNGTIRIIDRKKDLVKLQFGEYVSLGKVETELKTSSLVDNVCVYGSSFHSYLVALVAPNSKAIKNLGASLGKVETDYRKLCSDPAIIKAATEQICAHAKKCNLNKMEIPTKVKLCTEEWQPDSGLVTAAFKIRRKQIQMFYQSDIDDLYGENLSARI